ncbi:MAG: FHA domain-containing protein [Planctomycetota bacterium]
MARLVCIRGELEGSTFDIDKGLTIGRATHNTIVLASTRGVSREHAKVWKQGLRQYSVADLGSTNGTLVNDGRQDRSGLSDGDTVQVGDAVFRFELDEADRPSSPAPASAPASSGRAEASSLFTAPSATAEGGGDAAPAAGGMPQIVVKDRVLQYSKKADKGTQLGWDLSQLAGWQKLVFWLVGLGVAGALYFVVKNVF